MIQPLDTSVVVFQLDVIDAIELVEMAAYLTIIVISIVALANALHIVLAGNATYGKVLFVRLNGGYLSY